LVYGVYFAIATGLIRMALSHEDLTQGAIAGVTGGLLFGIWTGISTVRRRALYTRLVDPIPPEKLAEVFQFADKGPLPDNAEMRVASGRIVAYRLSKLGSALWATYIIFGAFGAFSLYKAITSGAVWWIFLIFFAAAVLAAVVRASRIRRRGVLFGVSAEDDVSEVMDEPRRNPFEI